MANISRIFAGILGIAFIAFGLVVIFQGQNERLDQVDLEQYTKEFSNNVLNHGYISEDMYGRFMEQISDLDVPLTVEMIHKYAVTSPKLDSSNNVINGECGKYYTVYNTDDIFNTLADKGKYTFNKGDYFEIYVTNEGKTTLSSLRSMIYRTGSETNNIEASAGGEIRNADY